MENSKAKTIKFAGYEIPIVIDDLLPPDRWMLLSPEQLEVYLEQRKEFEALVAHTHAYFVRSAFNLFADKKADK